MSTFRTHHGASTPLPCAKSPCCLIKSYLLEWNISDHTWRMQRDIVDEVMRGRRAPDAGLEKMVTETRAIDEATMKGRL